jgi:hypothetical protein
MNFNRSSGVLSSLQSRRGAVHTAVIIADPKDKFKMPFFSKRKNVSISGAPSKMLQSCVGMFRNTLELFQTWLCCRLSAKKTS